MDESEQNPESPPDLNVEHNFPDEVARLLFLGRQALVQANQLAEGNEDLAWWFEDIYDIVPGSSCARLVESALNPPKFLNRDETEPYALNIMPLERPVAMMPFLDGKGNLHIYQYHPTEAENIYTYETEVIIAQWNKDGDNAGIEMTFSFGRLLPGKKRQVKFAQNEAGEFTMAELKATHARVVASSRKKAVIQYVPEETVKVFQVDS